MRSLNNIRLKISSLALLVSVVSACSSTANVPLTVQSDPLGAQVLLRVSSENASNSDWIYLGNTPLTTQRRIDKSSLDRNNTFVVQVMKEGYINQTKEWSSKQVKDASKGDNRIFWSPRLIEINQ